MKIAIAGAGALGGRVGSQLFEAGYDVTLIDMWEEHVNKINTNGLEIQTETDTYTIDIPATLPKNIEGSFDLIIVLTKAMQSVEMVKTLEAQGAIREDTALLTMMNGLGHKDRLKKLIKEDHIFLAVTMWTAGLRGPGQILLEGSGSIIMQRADGVDTPLGHEINDIFNKAKLNSQLSDDVFLAIWEKVVVNSVLNPLCTILDKRIGEIAAYSEVDDMIGPLIQEIVDVANSRDVALEYNKSFEKIKFLALNCFNGIYNEKLIEASLNVFIKKFFQNQFKRSSMPDGPKITEISLSPRGDLKMSSDSSYNSFI